MKEQQAEKEKKAKEAKLKTKASPRKMVSENSLKSQITQSINQRMPSALQVNLHVLSEDVEESFSSGIIAESSQTAEA
jgi:hypothetical protein